MRNILATFALAFTVALGGCTSTGGLPQTQTDFTALIAQVQQYTATACGFVPTASSILSIVTGGNAGVVAGAAIAQAICSAVVPPKAGRKFTARTVKGWRVGVGTVNGVLIEGTRTR